MLADQSLVLQLQSDCLDKNVSLLEVLRKALVVARKLSVPEFEEWIRHELDGYKRENELPEYRKLGGQLKGANRLTGWMPIVFEDPEVERASSVVHANQSVGEIEAILSGPNKTGTLLIYLDPALQNQLRKGTGNEIISAVHVSTSGFQSILDHVRNAVLNWCLDLEKAGVLGAGMSFSVTEKEAAATVTNNIHFHDEVRTAQIQQGTNQSSQSMTYSEADLVGLRTLVESLGSNISQLGLAGEAAQQLTADLASMEGQLTAPRPSRGVISEALKSVRNILEGVAGNVIAAELLMRVGHYIGLS